MRTLIVTAALLLAGCRERAADPGDSEPGPSPQSAPAAATGLRWGLQSGDEGVALALASAPGTAAIRLFCAAGGQRLVVNVPKFRPIASEERLSFGSGGEVVALVADPRADPQRGGVSGTGAVPGDLAALIAGPVSASYGAQSSGPHPAPPSDLARAFVAACSAKGGPPSPPAPAPASACRSQDGRPVAANRIRAVGTEPFWGARIEGRCVTYSHPEDQEGTRVWTRFAGTTASGSWSGALGGLPFVLRTRPQPSCSDGMSDERYPIAVALTVGGEERTGCAEPY
ncbi:MAG TPA: hypothetical protein VFS45_04905 [Sphingomicrobium sp.]|nr:hypothetical protein [Sphingomicrobium sp.]